MLQLGSSLGQETDSCTLTMLLALRWATPEHVATHEASPSKPDGNTSSLISL